MPAPEALVIRTTNRIAALGAIIAVAVLPGTYFAISYQYQAGVLDTEARFTAELLSQLINAHPETWEFQVHRLEDVLGRRGSRDQPTLERIVGMNDRVILERGPALARPTLMRAAPLLDAGIPVGRIEIGGSLRPLLIRTGGAALVGLLLGMTVFVVLRVLPLRALGRSMAGRQRAEEQLRRANRALRVLSASNQALIRAEVEADFLVQVCQDVVEVGGYRFVWVGFAEEDEAQSIRAIAHAGVEDGYLQHVRASWGENERGRGPMGMAIRTHQPQILKDIGNNPAASPWREEALRRGYASMITLPLVAERRVFGALAIYAAEPDAFDAEEVELLTELASDLSFGIASLRAGVEHARAQDALQRQREMLYQTEKVAAMGQLLAGVAHELNNPLAVVVGQAALLERAAAGSPTATRAQKIAQAAERCARIVKNFLALARQRPPERQDVELNRVIQDAVELLAYPLRVDDVQVRLDLASDLPVLWADPHQLSQVVVNLVTNAHHAIRETSPPRQLSIATEFDRAGTRVVLRVTDTGPGIPPEVQARLFEPFFTTKPLGQGTGLGLSLCRGIVEGHGGTIRAERSPGHGAVFVVELPVVAPAAVSPETREAAGTLPPILGKRILVVDDEPEIRELVAEILAADAHEVGVAANGAVALEAVRAQRYDVILTDLKMPELDGVGFYRTLQHHEPELARRVVFLTGDTLGPDISTFLDQTAAPRVSKPFPPDEVRRVVQDVLRAQSAG